MRIDSLGRALARQIAPALLLWATLLPACDDGLTTTESAQILLEPPNGVEFARVRKGRFDTRTVEIRQAGSAPLTVTNIYVKSTVDPETGKDPCSKPAQNLGPSEDLPTEARERCTFVVLEHEALPKTLSADEFTQLSIRYVALDDEAPAPDTLVIESDALDMERMELAMAVTGAKPRIGASKTTVAFAEMVPGQEQQEILLVKNIGTGPLVVTDLIQTLETPQPTDPETGDPIREFVLDSDPLPWTIEEGDSKMLDIYYTPFDGDFDQLKLTFVSTDEEQPRFDVVVTSAPVSGLLVVNPDPVLFDTTVNRVVEKTISLSNPGLRTVDVLGLRLEPDNRIFSLGNQQTSFQLIGGGSREITVTYQPVLVEGHNAELIIESNADNADEANPDDPARKRTRVSLFGGAGPLPAILNVNPSLLGFEGVAPGASEPQTLTLSNDGGEDLVITRVELSGAQDSAGVSDPEFSVTAGGGPVTLAPGERHEVTVTFARPAGDRAAHFGTLVVESENGTPNPLTVPLTALTAGN